MNKRLNTYEVPDDLRQIPIQNNPLRIQTLPDHTEIDFYMPAEIDGIEEYIDFLRAVTDARTNDEVTIHINCYGGDITTAFNIIDVLATSQANIHISVEGNCCSAATMIALVGDTWDIMPHSFFMCHAYSSFRFGKRQELNASSEFDKVWLDKSIREIYKGFLTEDELERLMKGEDFYFTAEEVVTRLNNYKKTEVERQELTQKIAEKYQKLISDELTKELDKFDKSHEKTKETKNKRNKK